MEKLLLSARKSKKIVSTSRKMFFFKVWFPLISTIFSNSGKISSEHKFSLIGMKDSFENIFSLDEKVTFGGSNVKLEGMAFIARILAGTRFSINNLFVENTVNGCHT